MMRGSAAVLAITTYERDAYVRRGVRPQNIYVTGVGTDCDLGNATDQLVPQYVRDFPDYEKKKKIVFLGRKDPHKGIPDILQALRLLQMGRDDILFLCIGPETNYSRELWQQLPRHLRDQVLVLDSVSNGEKHALLQDSDVLVLMSTTESFGIVFLEAWLHGKPVIGARSGLPGLCRHCGAISGGDQGQFHNMATTIGQRSVDRQHGISPTSDYGQPSGYRSNAMPIRSSSTWNGIVLWK